MRKIKSFLNIKACHSGRTQYKYEPDNEQQISSQRSCESPAGGGEIAPLRDDLPVLFCHYHELNICVLAGLRVLITRCILEIKMTAGYMKV